MGKLGPWYEKKALSRAFTWLGWTSLSILRSGYLFSSWLLWKYRPVDQSTMRWAHLCRVSIFTGMLGWADMKMGRWIEI